MRTVSTKFLTAAILTLLVMSPLAHAQDSTAAGWVKSLVFDLTATQTAYSDSWVGGEAGSISWVGNLNGSAEKQLSPKFDFKSTLKMSFGQTHSQNEETKDWSKPVKSTDLIDWENVGRFTLHGAVDPYVAFRWETQFLDASVSAHKRYLSPMRFTESGGVARVLYKKDKRNIVTRAGFAIRQLMSKNFIDTIAYNTETVTTTDGGIESVTDMKWEVNEKLVYTGKLTLFKALFYSEKDKIADTEYADYWKAVDVNWENIVNATVSKVVSVNFYTQVLYDKQISKKGRFKQTLGIGLVVKLA